MTDEQVADVVKSFVPPGPTLVVDSEKFREVLTDALAAIVARVVATNRHRARNAALEEAARVCERLQKHAQPWWRLACEECEDAIRALKDKA